jgi:hypothetical protein
MRTFLPSLFLLFTLSLSAQYNMPNVAVSPFGYETSIWAIQPTITGNNTAAEANFSWGISFAGTAQLFRNDLVTVETGLQFGFSRITQTITERDLQVRPTNSIIRVVEADANVFHAGVPLFAKLMPGNFGGYLKAGARGLINFEPSTEGRIIDPGQVTPDNESPFPAGEVGAPAFNVVLETGVGYRFCGKHGREGYVEFNLGKPLRPVLEYAGATNEANQANYLDTTTAYRIGFSFGFRFGR